jgi:hypothetical protein
MILIYYFRSGFQSLIKKNPDQIDIKLVDMHLFGETDIKL